MRILEERKYTEQELAQTRTLRCRCGIGLRVAFSDLVRELVYYETGAQSPLWWFVCINCQQKTYIAEPYAAWKDHE